MLSDMKLPVLDLQYIFDALSHNKYTVIKISVWSFIFTSVVLDFT